MNELLWFLLGWTSACIAVFLFVKWLEVQS